MKKQTLSVLLSGLLTVSLTGVGFASWIITGDAEGTANGTVTVETIEDRRITLVKDTSKTDDTNVVFGHPTDTTAVTGTPWLQADSSTQAEDLVAVFNYKITNAKWADISVTYDDTLKDFIDDKYITFSSTVVYDNTKTEETTLTLTLNFGWGELFDNPDVEDDELEDPTLDNLNPYIFYNNHKTINDAQEAISTMEALSALTAFTITLSAEYNG